MTLVWIQLHGGLLLDEPCHLWRVSKRDSALEVLEAIKTHPDAFRSVFCYIPEEITTEAFERLFTVTLSPVGSTKAVTESLVLSRWSDYLQDIEDGEVSITPNEKEKESAECPPRVPDFFIFPVFLPFSMFILFGCHAASLLLVFTVTPRKNKIETTE